MRLIEIRDRNVVTATTSQFLVYFLVISVVLVILKGKKVLTAGRLSTSTITLLTRLRNLSTRLVTLRFSSNFQVSTHAVRRSKRVTVNLSLSKTRSNSNLSNVCQLSRLRRILNVINVRNFRAIIVTSRSRITRQFNLTQRARVAVGRHLRYVTLNDESTRRTVTVSGTDLTREGQR